MAILKNTR